MRYIAIMGLAIVVSMVAPSAYADIYLYIDKEGVMHFSNVPSNNRYRVYLKERSNTPVRELMIYNPDSDRYDHLIMECSQRHGIDFALIKAIIKVESGFNPNAISSKGAEGLMQLMPQTSAMLNILNPFDPTQNIEGGVRYLKYLMERFDQDLKLSLAAYNAGETLVSQLRKIPNYHETKNYVASVLRCYKDYQGTTPREKQPQ